MKRSCLTAPSSGLTVGILMLLAFGLRVWGIGFGLPYSIQPDEPSVEERALHMWFAADPNPHYFVYPSFYYDLQALWAGLTGHLLGLINPSILHAPLAHKPVFYVSARLFAALLGTATVGVVYAAGRLYSTAIGVFSGLFLAVTAQHIQQSHYITVDMPTGLFTALAAYGALAALRGGRSTPLMISAVAAGLAAGTKYNAALAIVMPLTAVMLSQDRPRWWRFFTAARVLLIVGITFFITTPFALLDHSAFLRSLTVVSRHYHTGHVGAEGNDNAVWYLSYLIEQGMQAPLTVLAIVGMGASLLLARRKALVILAFVISYYILLCSTYVRFDRNLLPLLPLLALLAGCAAEALVGPLIWIVRRRDAARLLIGAVAIVPTTFVAVYAAPQSDTALTRPFSEEVAVAWADTHLPTGARLATENWEGRPFELSPRRYRITHTDTLGEYPYVWYKMLGVQYIISDSYTDGAYIHASTLYRTEKANYRSIFRQAHLLIRIPGGSLEQPGPSMSIWEVRP